MHRWIDSIYARLLLAFVLMTLPLQCCHALIYDWCAQSVQQELVSTVSDNLSFIREELEANVSLIAQQLEYLLQNRAVTRLYYYSNAKLSDYYFYIMDAQNTLRLMQNGNPFVAEVRIYYPRLLRIISSDQYMPLALSSDEVQTMLAEFRAQGFLLVEREDTLSVEGMHPASCYGTEKTPYYLASARLKKDKISALLSSFDLDGGNYVFLRNEATGTIYRNTLAAAHDVPVPVQDAPTTEAEFIQSSVWVDGEEYLCMSCWSKYLNCTFFQLIPIVRLFALPNQLLRYTRLFTALLVLFVCAYALTIYRMVQRPVNDLTMAFQGAQNGRFDTRLSGRYPHEFSILAAGFNQMVAQIQALIQSTYESRIRTQQAEYRQLQAQINPHFLYNSFYLLRHFLREDTIEHADQLCAYLGDYFRFITDQSQDMLPLEEEYEHALTYLRIQQLRFGDFLCADMQPVPESLRRTPVPRLILQPLFENAVEHGVPTQAETAQVRLRFEETTDVLRVRFEDNGDQLTDGRLTQMQEALSSAPPPDGDAHALVNTHRRLQILYGEDCGLQVERSPLGGLCVLLTLKHAPLPNGHHAKEDGHGRSL